MIAAFLKKVDTKKLFVESDAWWLFKYSALSEVVGWTLLIYGIVAVQYRLPGASYMLPLGGSIHGILFLTYISILIATYSSLEWTRGKALGGLLVSALPYGTFFFEQWASKQRSRHVSGSYRRIIVRGIIAFDGLILAIQPNNGVVWQLPGGQIGKDERAEDALARLLEDLTGVTPSVGSLLHFYQPKGKKSELELYFTITNASDFRTLDVKEIMKKRGDIEELQFINAAHTPDLEPSFLQSLLDDGRRNVINDDQTDYRDVLVADS